MINQKYGCFILIKVPENKICKGQKFTLDIFTWSDSAPWDISIGKKIIYLAYRDQVEKSKKKATFDVKKITHPTWKHRHASFINFFLKDS